MRKFFLILVFFLSVIPIQSSFANTSVELRGAGASFPYPLYAWWSLRYSKSSGTKISYDSIGSGGGIKRIKAKEVDFGATDAPLSREELEKHGLIQFATVLGGVVPIINVPGVAVGDLKLSGTVLADIFMGKVRNWNDEAIRSLNPGLSLPNLAIHVVHRAGSSGTTWIFTNYLSKVSPVFDKKVGFGKVVSWPVGNAVKGTDGLVKQVQAVEGSIGYGEYAYAVQDKLNYVTLQNRSGNFVHPNHESFQAAASNVDWSSAGTDLVITDKEGKQAWPITAVTFILIHQTQNDPVKAKELINFFSWCYREEGDQLADNIDYVPLPESVMPNIRNEWDRLLDQQGSKIF